MFRKKDIQFLNLCKKSAEIFSTCSKRQYCCILTDERDRIVGFGYNGGPSGHPHCVDGACERAKTGAPSGSNYDNCFRGDTEIMTPLGVETLFDAYSFGSRDLLTSKGWQSAKVDHFGQQMTYKLVLRKGKARKEVFTTANHRWFVVDSHRKKRELTTLELRPNHHYLASVYPRTGKYIPSNEGIRAGLVFGDGSCNYAQRGSGSFIYLHGPAARDLGYLFDSNPARNLPRLWKTSCPDLEESYEYLGGWFAGYFAADGCISGQTARLDSVSRENLEYVIELCSVLGIPYSRITEYERPDFNGVLAKMYSLHFPQNAIPDKLILLEHHKSVNNRIKRTRDFPRWVVDSITESKEEDVFCAVVPGFGEFALKDNILTGNCISIHAEQNAFLNMLGTPKRLYVNGPPCFTCAKLTVNTTVEEIIYCRDESYKQWPEVALFLEENGITLKGFSG